MTHKLIKNFILIFFVFNISLVFAQNAKEQELINAIENKNDQKVLNLTRAGINVNCATSDGVTALMYAVQNNNFYACNLLLQKGANPNSQDQFKYTALINACQFNYIKIAEILLKNKAKPNMKDNENQTAIFYAVKYGFKDIVKLLIKYNANTRDIYQSCGLLHIAAYMENTETLDVLLDNKIDVNVKDGNGLTPLMVAAIFNKQKSVDKLLIANANVFIVSSEGLTALDYAAINGNTSIIYLLLNKKAEINHKISPGIRTLDLAKANKQKDAYNYLKKKGAKSDMIPVVGSINIGLIQNFTYNDYFIGAELGITEWKTNSDIALGYMGRPGYYKAWVKQSDYSYFQLHEKRNYVYLKINKHFSLPTRFKSSVFVGIKPFYNWGDYKAVNIKYNSNFFVAGRAGFAYHMQKLRFTVGYEYLHINAKRISSHRIFLNIFYTFNNKVARINKPKYDWLKF